MPIIAADTNGWDDGYTLNPTAIYLERSPKNDEVIKGMLGVQTLDDPRLARGAVAVLYRGVPREKPGLPTLRSSVGLAVFTPNLELVKRFPYPVIVPSDDPMGCDYNGVEDQRVTKIGDTFYLVYCGFNPRLSRRHNIHICMAESKDLIHWTKLGPVAGSVNDVPNKDAVLMADKIEGYYVMLHRPCIGYQGSLSISIAVATSVTGEWTDLGTIMKPVRHPKYRMSWVGGGSTPLAIGGNRYLCDYHTGNYFATGERDYFGSYAILNFDRFDVNHPERIVETRCEGVIVPETEYELDSPWPHDKTLNCVFPCGSYELDGDIVLTYGGADAYVLGARLNKEDLVAELEGTGYCPILEVANERIPVRSGVRIPRPHASGIRHRQHVPADPS